jgi:hypothetical protein
VEIGDGERMAEFVRGEVDLCLNADPLAELVETSLGQGLTLL